MYDPLNMVMYDPPGTVMYDPLSTVMYDPKRPFPRTDYGRSFGTVTVASARLL